MRIGIIGTGWIAGSHMLAYKHHPNMEVVAGADLIPGKAEAFFKVWKLENVKCYPSHKEMLDDETRKLDAVSICTYNRQHATAEFRRLSAPALSRTRQPESVHASQILYNQAIIDGIAKSSEAGHEITIPEI